MRLELTTALMVTIDEPTCSQLRWTRPAAIVTVAAAAVATVISGLSDHPDFDRVWNCNNKTRFQSSNTRVDERIAVRVELDLCATDVR